MAADMYTKSDFSIPGLVAHKSGGKLPPVKLLRKPRKPAPLSLYEPAPPTNYSSPPKSFISDLHSDNKSLTQTLSQREQHTSEPSDPTTYNGLASKDDACYNSTNSPQPPSPVEVSPPPPSEYFSQCNSPTPILRKTPHSGQYSNSQVPPSRGQTYHSTVNSNSRNRGMRSETKYILDTSHRGKTSLGTYVEGQSLVKPYKPRGPDALPARPPKRQPEIIRVPFFDFDYHDEIEEIRRYYRPPEFTLQDFLIQVTEQGKVPMEFVKNVMFSKHNYKKIQKLLFELVLQPRKQIAVHSMEFKPPDDMPHVSPRVPQKQLLLEMASLVKEQMSVIMHSDMKSVIRPLPRFSPDYKPHVAAPHTEIVLYEDTTQEKIEQKRLERQNTEIPGTEAVFHASTAKYFQGAKRSNSPFAMNDDNLISPTELAVLDALMSGGVALSLKAHFVSHLPDIEPLTKTITYLNLSFNDFRTIPFEIFDITQLTILKMRNNPLREIPTEISRLRHLNTLVFSFCNVSSLPLGLFSLKKLEHLDIAYNKISFIPNEIRHLKRLMEFNVEGNQLPALPVGLVRLKNLRYLRVRCNFMHPLFWKENTNNEPQRLQDLAALMCKNQNIPEKVDDLPDNIEKILHSHTKCDVCKGPLFGMGLRIIRPVRKIFGIKNLPFMFRCCSPYCTQLFNSNSESLMEMLYGEEMGKV